MNSRNIALLVAGLVALTALILVVNRGGLLAWTGLIAGAALFAKSWFKSSRVDLALSGSLAAILALAWVGTYSYVISTYESGEVVELTIDTRSGGHTVRLWALDMGADPVVYYDADPEVAEALLTGNPLQFRRGDEVSTRIPEATPVDELGETEASQVLEAMGSKYGERVGAADVYYVLLGNPRDRVALVARLVEE